MKKQKLFIKVEEQKKKKRLMHQNPFPRYICFSNNNKTEPKLKLHISELIIYESVYISHRRWW